MSCFLQMIGSELFGIAGLSERLVSWGDEDLPTDPRRFLFSSLEMDLLPIPRHVRCVLPRELGDHTVGFQLAEDIVIQWGSNRISTRTELDLQRLFETISALPHWAIIYETGSGTGTQTLRWSTGRLYDLIDSTIRVRTDHDLIMVIPRTLAD
jgi:hypothetical protein